MTGFALKLTRDGVDSPIGIAIFCQGFPIPNNITSQSEI